jgi:hypothetical protein
MDALDITLGTILLLALIPVYFNLRTPPTEKPKTEQPHTLL